VQASHLMTLVHIRGKLLNDACIKAMKICMLRQHREAVFSDEQLVPRQPIRRKVVSGLPKNLHLVIFLLWALALSGCVTKLPAKRTLSYVRSLTDVEAGVPAARDDDANGFVNKSA